MAHPDIEAQPWAGHIMPPGKLGAMPHYADPDSPLLRVARNMDFFPAKLLGPGTVLTVWRRPGVRTVIGVGWPGYAGIVSGMNDAGLSVCILLQHGAPAETNGILQDNERQHNVPELNRVGGVVPRIIAGAAPGSKGPSPNG